MRFVPHSLIVLLLVVSACAPRQGVPVKVTPPAGRTMEFSVTRLAEPDLLADLSEADLKIRKEKVRRDYAIETVRKLDQLGPGDYAMNVTTPDGSRAFHASVVHPEANAPIWLIAASYSADSGLTLRLSEPLALRNADIDPFEVFLLETEKHAPVDAKTVFKSRANGNAPRITPTSYGLILPIVKEDKFKKSNLSDHRVLLNWRVFELRFQPVWMSGVRLEDRSAPTK